MQANLRLTIIVLTTIILSATAVSGQNTDALSEAEKSISKQALRQYIELLVDEQCEGRASGSAAIDVAKRFIATEFYKGGLQMIGQAYSYGFYFWNNNTECLGINVVGTIAADSTVVNPKTIVVGAHYDHLGILAGKTYSGADNNASGVAAVIELGKAFAKLAEHGIRPMCNICFVAFDAKELGSKGSEKFLADKIVEPTDISLMINLDQIGTTLAPPEEAKTQHLLPNNYLLLLGKESVKPEIISVFENSNTAAEPIVLDFSYYGNSHIYNIMNNIGDQVPFRNAGIPAISITSGIHKYTNKTSDDISIINFNALTQRCRFVFRVICKLAGIKK